MGAMAPAWWPNGTDAAVPAPAGSDGLKTQKPGFLAGEEPQLGDFGVPNMHSCSNLLRAVPFGATK